MALTNTSRPTTTLANTSKVSFAELWSTITTTWASETRTWADVVSLIDNVVKPSFPSLMLIEEGGRLLTEADTRIQLELDGMTNVSKPA